MIVSPTDRVSHCAQRVWNQPAVVAVSASCRSVKKDVWLCLDEARKSTVTRFAVSSITARNRDLVDIASRRWKGRRGPAKRHVKSACIGRTLNSSHSATDVRAVVKGSPAELTAGESPSRQWKGDAGRNFQGVSYYRQRQITRSGDHNIMSVVNQ